MAIELEGEREYSVEISINFELRGGRLNVADLRDGVYFAIRKAISLDYLTECKDTPDIVAFDVKVVSKLESSAITRR